MLSRLNSRIKSRTETGPGYDDLEESSVNDAQSVNGNTSPFSSSFIFSQTEFLEFRFFKLHLCMVSQKCLQ